MGLVPTGYAEQAGWLCGDILVRRTEEAFQDREEIQRIRQNPNDLLIVLVYTKIRLYCWWLAIVTREHPFNVYHDGNQDLSICQGPEGFKCQGHIQLSILTLSIVLELLISVFWYFVKEFCPALMVLQVGQNTHLICRDESPLKIRLLRSK